MTLPRALRLTPLAAAVAVFGQVALAADADPSAERITVTGSNIKRIAKEGPAPVQVISRQDIDKSGVATVADLLRNLPANATGNYNETFTNSFSPGSSAISLRGLGSKSTLTLLNGRRLANYGFAQNLQETSVDLNSIPQEAVERIEILKDGASAIYGADAIAGVVNIILRKDYTGLQLTAKAGGTTEGGAEEYGASIAGGFGSLTENRFNAMGVLQVFKREKLMYSDRNDIYNDGDARELVPGSTVNWSSFSEYPTYRKLSSADTIFAGSTRPAANCPADRIIVLPGGSAPVCYTDLTPYGVLIPSTERVGFTGRAVFALSEDTQLFAEALFNRNTTDTPGAPPTWGASTTFSSSGARPFPLTLPVGHPNNPYNRPVGLSYRFTDIGTSDSTVKADLYRLLVGVKGSFHDWDWEVAALDSKGKTERTQVNLLSVSGLTQVLNDRSYDFLDHSKNTAAVLNRIRANTVRTADTTFRQVDAKVAGTLTELPAGPLQLAAGVEFRKESLDDVSSDNLTKFDVLGLGYTTNKADRDANSVYGELNIPVFKDAEVQLAVRRDDYDDFGSATTPKVAFRFQPLRQLLLRGSYTEGFRAPTFAENGTGVSYSFQTITDKRRCDLTRVDPNDTSKGFKIDPVTGRPYTAANYCQGASISTQIEPNRNVKPEKSRSYALGFVFEPNSSFSAAVDWYDIQQRDLIIRPAGNDVVKKELEGNADKVLRDVPTANDQIRGMPGPIIFVKRVYAQLDQKTTVKGIDLDLKGRTSATAYGRFSVSSNIGYTISRKSQDEPGAELESTNGVDGNPRMRARTSFGWSRGDVDLTLSHNFIDNWRYTEPTLDTVEHVPSWNTYDLQANYTLFKKTRLTLGANNVFDKQAPLNANEGTILYNYTLYDLRGRYVYGSISHQF
ncbi:TonB-dependent receptor [Chitinimonas koreensis]|uniref:TonB-dependent receptor n=1 Tax=Chitinimonas koreensis TaxID=356302 RepID=UPI0004137A31|nr:TonB-dependent receptor [Chitinimonas koreensis]QNM95214.1 TonB-dependent receptor [Chitinimonas koreensis]